LLQAGVVKALCRDFFFMNHRHSEECLGQTAFNRATGPECHIRSNLCARILPDIVANNSGLLQALEGAIHGRRRYHVY